MKSALGSHYGLQERGICSLNFQDASCHVIHVAWATASTGQATWWLERDIFSSSHHIKKTSWCWKSLSKAKDSQTVSACCSKRYDRSTTIKYDTLANYFHLMNLMTSIRNRKYNIGHSTAASHLPCWSPFVSGRPSSALTSTSDSMSNVLKSWQTYTICWPALCAAEPVPRMNTTRR